MKTQDALHFHYQFIKISKKRRQRNTLWYYDCLKLFLWTRVDWISWNNNSATFSIIISNSSKEDKMGKLRRYNRANNQHIDAMWWVTYWCNLLFYLLWFIKLWCSDNETLMTQSFVLSSVFYQIEEMIEMLCRYNKTQLPFVLSSASYQKRNNGNAFALSSLLYQKINDGNVVQIQ